MKKITLAVLASLTLSAIVFVFMIQMHEREIDQINFSHQMEIMEKDRQIQMGFTPYMRSFVTQDAKTKHDETIYYLSHMRKADIIEVRESVTEDIPLKNLCDEVLHFKDSLELSMN